MNIFVLDKDPFIAAQMLCDKHVPKMLLESAQLLCSAHDREDTPYKKTHVNHPCTKWVRESLENYAWLCLHAAAIADEHTLRFHTSHKSIEVIVWCSRNFPTLPAIGMTPFALAMPDKYKNGDPVEAYRAYYKGEKWKIAKWGKGRPKPKWY